jgi:hypothetical protein
MAMAVGDIILVDIRHTKVRRLPAQVERIDSDGTVHFRYMHYAEIFAGLRGVLRASRGRRLLQTDTQKS